MLQRNGTTNNDTAQKKNDNAQKNGMTNKEISSVLFHKVPEGHATQLGLFLVPWLMSRHMVTPKICKVFQILDEF